MTPTSEISNEQLIYLAALETTRLQLTTDHPLAIMFNRFRVLTQDRSDLVEKCVEAVMIAIKINVAESIQDQFRITIRTALTQVLNPENK